MRPAMTTGSKVKSMGLSASTSTSDSGPPVRQKEQCGGKADKKFGPSFPKEVKDLDKQQVKLYGFMMPLDQAKQQKRFLLSAFPPHCSFCLTGGPESLVEVLADKPIDFTFEPVVIAGRMAVLDDDVVYYRLTNAVSVKP